MQDFVDRFANVRSNQRSVRSLSVLLFGLIRSPGALPRSPPLRGKFCVRGKPPVRSSSTFCRAISGCASIFGRTLQNNEETWSCSDATTSLFNASKNQRVRDKLKPTVSHMHKTEDDLAANRKSLSRMKVKYEQHHLND